MAIDETKTFIPINIAVLTVSDRRTLETDTSGQTLVERLMGAGHKLGITRVRGRWHEYHTPGLAAPIPAMPLFHPAYLLRSPQQKRFAWRDLLSVRERLGPGFRSS